MASSKALGGRNIPDVAAIFRYPVRVCDHTSVRKVGKALGWVVSLLIMAGLVALAVAAQALGDTPVLARRVAWIILAGLGGVALVFAIVVAVHESRPHRRQARRLAREQEREKRRKLENFELE